MSSSITWTTAESVGSWTAAICSLLTASCTSHAHESTSDAFGQDVQ